MARRLDRINALTLCHMRTPALRAHIITFLLCKARVRRKIIFWHQLAVHTRGFKGRSRKERQNCHEIPSGCFPVFDRWVGSLAKFLAGMLWIGHYGLCLRINDSPCGIHWDVRRSAWAASALVGRLVEINLQSICRDHSQFVQHGNIRMISTFSVLTSFMQVLIIIGGGGGGGTCMCTGHPSSRRDVHFPRYLLWTLGDVHSKFNVASWVEKFLEWSAQGI